MVLIKEQKSCIRINTSFTALDINFGSDLYTNNNIVVIFASQFFLRDYKGKSYYWYFKKVKKKTNYLIKEKI